MREFVSTGYKAIELATLNRCQMWLQVTQLSEICNGGNILIEPWEGKAQTQSGWSWPQTVKPEPTEWKEWQRALANTFALNKHWGLKEKLGKWSQQQKPVIGWYVDLETKRLYHCNGALSQVHTQIPRCT